MGDMSAAESDRSEFVFSKTIWNSFGDIDAIFAFVILYAVVRVVTSPARALKRIRNPSP